MLLEFIGLVLHRYIRSGDTIRVYGPDGRFFAKRRVTIEGSGAYACVRLVDDSPYVGIRRDLPRWNDLLGCWTYKYDE